MKLQERIYATTDGRLVREGDPAGAFLKFAIGDEPGTDYADEVSKLVGPVGVTSLAYHDDDARDALRVRQAEPTAANMAVAAAQLADDPNAPVLLHDRLATELADEARERANREQALELSATASDQRLFRTADGDLVKAGDPRGEFLAYAPGDKIRRGDLDSFEALQDDDDDDRKSTSDGEKVADPVTPTPAPSDPPAKKATPAKAPARTS